VKVTVEAFAGAVPLTLGTVKLSVTVCPEVVALGLAEMPSFVTGTLLTVTVAVGAAPA
jgi:hypothetical protein